MYGISQAKKPIVEEEASSFIYRDSQVNCIIEKDGHGEVIRQCTNIVSVELPKVIRVQCRYGEKTKNEIKKQLKEHSATSVHFLDNCKIPLSSVWQENWSKVRAVRSKNSPEDT